MGKKSVPDKKGIKLSAKEKRLQERMLAILEHAQGFTKPTWWRCYPEDEAAYALLESRGVIERRVAFGRAEYRLVRSESKWANHSLSSRGVK